MLMFKQTELFENDVENLEFESLCIIVMTHFIAFQINFLFLFW